MDSIRDQMEDAARVRRADLPAAQARYQEASQKRLRKIIQTKMRTTFVGDVARVEQHLGALWGHGLVEAQLTPSQRTWRQLWLQLRNDILTNGNNQLRALEKELAQYVIEWHAYQNRFPVTGEAKEDPR
jgi:hypothetical protein